MNVEAKNSSIELLRILSMFLIILNHLCMHGFQCSTDFSINNLIIYSITSWTGNVGNYLFIFISCYYLIDSRIHLKKIVKLWFTLFSISVFFGILFYTTKIPIIGYLNRDYSLSTYIDAAKPLTKKELFLSFVPLLRGDNWYISTYVVFYCFCPFLFKLHSALKYKEYGLFVILLIVLGTIVRMLPGQKLYVSSQNWIYHFIMCYFVIGFYKKFNIKVSNKSKVIIPVAGLILFITYNCLIYYISISNFYVKENLKQIMGILAGSLARFPVFCVSFFIFLLFIENFYFKSIFVNRCAKYTLFVYLIHENQLFNRFMWHKLLFSDYFYQSKYLLVYIFLVPIVVYSLCALFGAIYTHCFINPVVSFSHSMINNLKKEVIN